MSLPDKVLVKKLATVVVFKLIFLLAWWWGYLREGGIEVDQYSVAALLLQPAAASAVGTMK